MSAWLVSKAHIDLLATYAHEEGLTFGEMLDPQKIGEMLWAENVASLDARYPGRYMDDELRAEVAGYVYAPAHTATLYAGNVWNAARCLDYRSCEHEGWRASTACALVDAIEAHALAAAGGEPLDGVSLPWGHGEANVTRGAPAEPAPTGDLAAGAGDLLRLLDSVPGLEAVLDQACWREGCSDAFTQALATMRGGDDG